MVEIAETISGGGTSADTSPDSAPWRVAAENLISAARTPMMICWGNERALAFNPSFTAIVEAGGESWRAYFADLSPILDAVLEQGQAVTQADRPLLLERQEEIEETFFTFALSAIRDDRGQPAGVLITATDTTSRIAAERRMICLRELAESSIRARTAQEVLERSISALEASCTEVVFALAYLAEPGADRARLVASFGVGPSTERAYWPMGQLAPSFSPILIDENRRGTALVRPLIEPGREHATGVLVVGASPRRALDDDYRRFVEIAAAQASAALATARALESETKRSQALSAIDRAKTVFFGNVSHQFRTPLTLMLRPLEDVLDESETGLTQENREKLDIAHRNALRLLKLVNTLLDFSRIEAGRVPTAFQATDLPTLTRDVASIFAAAMKKADLQYVVDCAPLDEDVYVDREMWEKIVLNLLSNAFKFTFRGGVNLVLKKTPENIVLAVRDTGVGIPKDEQARVFDRFHQVRGSRARTRDGTGIGLSLVRELVRLHGGTVTLASVPGIGTEVIVEIPRGKDHLRGVEVGARKMSSTSIGLLPYMEEATRWADRADEISSDLAQISDTSWLSDRTGKVAAVSEAPQRPRVLVCEDNRDMRSYLTRLLSRSWSVEPFSDAAFAFARAREVPPDLVICDAMQADADSFDLLRELRAHRATKGVPVLVISTRGGEESRVEGFEAGADDYLVKPFSARELTARARALLEMARVRRELTEKERAARAEAEESRRFLSTLIGNLPGTAYRGRADTDRSMEFVSEGIVELTGYRASEFLENKLAFSGLIHSEDRARVTAEIAAAVKDEDTYHLVYRLRGADGKERWVREQGRCVGFEQNAVPIVEGFVTDISELKSIEEQLRGESRAAESANRAKDEFLAILSHEMRTPLNAMMGWSQLLVHEKLDPPSFGRAARSIERNTKVLSQLIQDLLDVSRIVAGKLRLDVRPQNVAALVYAAMETVRAAAEAKGVALLWELTAENDLVSADPARLQQVFWNLLSNAIKFTKPNGKVWVKVFERDARLVVEISDDGKGIAPEFLPHIFDRFQQADSSSTRAHGGLGIGLAIAHHLVVLHGGTLRAESEGLDQGTKMSIELSLERGPQAPTVVNAAGRPAAVPVASFAGVNILVVDDEPDARELITEVLERSGATVSAVGSAREALEALQVLKPAVLVSDIGMPALDGYWLIDAIRKLDADRGGMTPALALTAYAAEQDRSRALAAGFQYHLTKPIDAAELLATIAALTRSTSRQES